MLLKSKIPKYIIDDLKISSDFNRESSNEEDFNEENFGEKILLKEVLMKKVWKKITKKILI